MLLYIVSDDVSGLTRLCPFSPLLSGYSVMPEMLSVEALTVSLNERVRRKSLISREKSSSSGGVTSG